MDSTHDVLEYDGDYVVEEVFALADDYRHYHKAQCEQWAVVS